MIGWVLEGGLQPNYVPIAICYPGFDVPRLVEAVAIVIRRLATALSREGKRLKSLWAAKTAIRIAFL
jgi:hypothetical protein